MSHNFRCPQGSYGLPGLRQIAIEVPWAIRAKYCSRSAISAGARPNARFGPKSNTMSASSLSMEPTKEQQGEAKERTIHP